MRLCSDASERTVLPGDGIPTARSIALLPDLLQCGFQFISLEPECVDLLRFKKANRSRVCLIGGIRVDWLTAKVFDQELQADCLKEIGALIREGGLVLSSTCGLYRPEFLPNFRKIYQLMNQIIP